MNVIEDSSEEVAICDDEEVANSLSANYVIIHVTLVFNA